MSLYEYKALLAGKPKNEKLRIIEQELNNRGLSKLSIHNRLHAETQLEPIPTTEQLNTLLDEIKHNPEAYESTTTRKELIPFIYDRDLDWFFNAKNIPAQTKLVLPTYEYFNEGKGKETFEPLLFLNLLYRSQQYLLYNLDKPYSIIQELKKIPLTEYERHILFGFLLKWFGGYPTSNLDEQVNTVLTLIQKEFLAYPENTDLKKICRADFNAFEEVAAHLSAEMPGVKIITPRDSEQPTNNYIFPESRYVNKIAIDFEDLPDYIIRKGIIWNFEAKNFNKANEYLGWKTKFEEFIATIPKNYKRKFFAKAFEYGEKVQAYHKMQECNDDVCVLDESWSRRLVIVEDLIKTNDPVQKKSVMNEMAKNDGFLIHGRNNEFKLEVARFLENQLHKTITILHEQPNQGLTIIEKFENYAEVKFAVALWTADDTGKLITESEYKLRPRQNVLFETGFFIGKLSRRNVIVIYEEGIDIPSDYHGVCFISMEDWKENLRKEIISIYNS